MKWNFLYQITDASRTPDYGATTPQIPVLSSTEFVEPRLKKIPGYATGTYSVFPTWTTHTSLTYISKFLSLGFHRGE